MRVRLERKRLLTWFYPPKHKVWDCFPDAEAASVVVDVTEQTASAFGNGIMLKLPNGALIMDYQATKLQ